MNTQEALNNIILDKQFANLTELLQQDDIFHILGIQDREVPFTKLLTWLLDPSESHGMGSKPLIRFMLQVHRCASNKLPECTIEPIQIETLNFSKVSLIAEKEIPRASKNKGRIDILAEIAENEKNSPLLIIEAKINARHGEQQTQDYRHWAEENQNAEQKPLMVYLAPTAADVEQIDSQFVHMDFHQMYLWLCELDSSHKSQQAEFLLTELKKVTENTERATQDEVQELVVELGSSFEEEIKLLNTQSLSQYQTLQKQYQKPFGKLGIVGLSRTSSKGSSQLIDHCRQAFDEIFDETMWSIKGGGGSIIIRHRETHNQANHEFSDIHDGLMCEYFLDRDSSSLGFSIFSAVNKLEKIGIDREQNKKLRYQLVDSLRNRLEKDPELSPYLAKGRSFKVIKFPFTGDSFEDIKASFTKGLKIESHLEAWHQEAVAIVKRNIG